MNKYVLPAIAAIGVIFSGLYFWKQYNSTTTPSICADDVRGLEESISSSLSAAAESFQKVSMETGAGSSRTYVEELSSLRPSDLLALKACDAQCKLLERCLGRSSVASAAEACPTEYKDYRDQVAAASQMMQKIEEYQQLARDAAVQQESVTSTEADLKEAEASAGASGGREAVLRQKLVTERAALARKVTQFESLARGIATYRAKN